MRAEMDNGHDEDDPMYMNTNAVLRLRMHASGLTGSATPSKKKPMPSPKPLQKQNARKPYSSGHVSHTAKNDKHNSLSSGGLMSTTELDEPIYDDVYLRNSNSAFPKVPEQSTVMLRNDNKDSRRECLSLFPSTSGKSKSARSFEPKLTEVEESQYSEALPVVGQLFSRKTDMLHVKLSNNLRDFTLESCAEDVLGDTGSEDPQYEEVVAVRGLIKETNLKPMSSANKTTVKPLTTMQMGAVYEEAETVDNDHLADEELSKSLLYDTPEPVVASRLEGSEAPFYCNTAEALYDDPIMVCPHKLTGSELEEEPVYDEACPVVMRLKSWNDQEEAPVYDTAMTVDTSKLQLEDSRLPLENSGLISVRCPLENPYNRAASVRGSFSEDSSDEDEPTCYDLLLVKMSMERCNQMLYANLGSPLTMENLEKKAHRLSRLWGNAPKAEIYSPDHHQQLKPVKSDSYMKEMTSGCDDYQAEDIENEVAESFTSCVAKDDQIIMRKWIVTHMLESEKVYISILDLLFEHMQTFKSVANTEKCVIQSKDNDVIFFKITELHKSHYQFLNSLGKKVDNWSSDQQVGEIFRNFASQEYAIAREYLKNYHTAIRMVRHCWTENPVFAELTKDIPVKLGKTGTLLSLEELLHKPIVRFQQNTLSLKDLIKSTPLDHPDYDILQRALKTALNCLNECSGVGCRNSNHQRYLVKHSLVVEKVNNLRKLRHIFLFSDVLICAKQKLYSRYRNYYETKWFIPLQDLQLDEKFSAQADKQSATLHHQMISTLEKELVRLQVELKQEMKKSKKFQSSDLQQPNRRSENLQKKVLQQEAALLEASPYLELKVTDKMFGRVYFFLLSSDYERTTWKDAISGMTAKVDASAPRITGPEVANLLQLHKIPKVMGSSLKAKVISPEKEHLSGCLKITIHKLIGLTEEAETFCTIEIDSFGHFFLKAKTHQCKSREPSWQEDFDIDLDGAQTLHLLCYRIGKGTDHLLGKCALELNTAWLSEEFEEQLIPLTDELVIMISLKYIPQDQMRRRSVCLDKGTFGVKLETITTREHQLVPLIVTSCIEEIEAQGLDELGLYRVSGLASDVERLKNAFNKNGATAVSLVKTVDVNVLTSLLKLFFRELPESLFTDAAYHQLVKGIGLADPEAKEKFLLNTFKSLPKCNSATISYVLDHLIRVCKNKDKNKMTLENLATVFGPTLLHPAETDRKPMTMEQRLWLGTNDIAAQATILLCFLKMKTSGCMSTL